MNKLLLAVLLLAGCASTPVEAPSEPVQPSYASTLTSTQVQYLEAVESLLGPVNREATLDAGELTCSSLDYVTPLEFINDMHGIDEDTLVAVMGNAVKYLCPRHAVALTGGTKWSLK